MSSHRRAAQACAVSQQLGFPAERVNPNGGAVALGHPIGASGAIKLIYELARTGGRYGLGTMCSGGGQGIAVVMARSWRLLEASKSVAAQGQGPAHDRAARGGFQFAMANASDTLPVTRFAKVAGDFL